jgi:PKD repeat protein
MLLPLGLYSQTTIVSMPIDGSTDTTTECSGILVDGGGINGNYTAYNNGYVVIDPPGNDTVTLSFTTWSLYHSSDWIQVWDGAGTSGTTYIGYYSGTSTLPSSFTGSSGAITIRFYSNYFGNAAGFVANWSTTGTTAPTANFTYATQSQNYNTPIQFVNTSSNGGLSFWDFGDGTSSTVVNPIHNFSTSGPNTITLIESNCNSSDTITSTINIANGPNIGSFDDTITILVPCNTTATEYWTLSNDSGAGPLIVDVEVYDTAVSEHIHFDNDTEGAYMSAGFASISRTTAAAQGSHALSITSASSSAVMSIPVVGGGPGFQPTYFAYRTKASTSSYRACKFQMASDNTFAPSVLGYTFWYSDGRLGIRRRSLSGSLGFEYLNNSLGNWAHIEYRNIDWGNETFDLFIDGTYHDSYKFLNPTTNLNSNYASYLRLVNDNSSDLVYLDDIKIGFGSNTNNLSISPSSATVLGGMSTTFSLQFDATGLTSGQYYSSVVVTSNDTTINNDTIPVIATVEGSYEFTTAIDTLYFGNIPSGKFVKDSLEVINTGCTDLVLDSIRCFGSNFTVAFASLASGDTSYIFAEITAPTAGTYIDSAQVFTSDSSFTRYLKAIAYDAPAIRLDSTTFNVAVMGCPDSVNIPFWIFNEGQQTLNWGTYSSGVTIQDDFESNTLSSSLWSTSYGTNVGSTCSSIDGQYSLAFYGVSGQRYATTVGLNLLQGGTISFDLEQGSCEYADSGEGIYLQYSTDGLNWINIQYFYPSSTTTTYYCTATIPTGAMTMNTQIRLAQLLNSGSSYDNLIVDNFSIDAGLGQNLIFTPDTGNVSASDSELVQILIYTDSLQDGYYTYNGFISTNDPLDTLIYVTVNLSLDGESETFINRSSCYDLDTIVNGGVYVDSVFVENLGCDSLYFNSLTASNSIFSVSVTHNEIGVGDSGWVVITISPTTIGSISDTVFVNTSDTIWTLCYTGYIEEAPNAWINTTPIILSTINCGDSTAFSFPIANTSFGTSLDWSVTSSEVLNVLMVNYNVYPALLTKLDNYLDGIPNMNIKSVTTLGAALSELGWADVVIFPSITSTPSTTDYTNIEDDMETFINDGGKMVIIGSAFVNDILSMDFISGYYYGNYTNYTHYVNTTLNHPYTQGLPSNFTAQSAAMNSRITNTGTEQLVYQSYYSHGLTLSPIGDGELIYFAYNWSQVYTEIETMMGNILNTTLSEKSTGLNWISFNNYMGSTTGGDTTTVSGTAFSDSLDAGVYNLNITVNTNDPTGGSFSIPVTLTVNGKGESELDSGCEAWGSSFQNMMHERDVAVYNVGCDTLTISSAVTAGSEFTASVTNLIIAPGDTGYVQVSLYSSTIGSISDTLSIYTDADTVYKCLTATIVGASDISVAPNPINVTVNNCNSFTTVPYTITNNGSAVLTYDVSVAEIYDSAYTQTWLYSAPNYSNQLTFSFNNIINTDTLFYEIILNGEYSTANQYFYLYVNNNYNQTFYDNDVTDYTNDTITGFITGLQLNNAITAGYLDIRLYSYNYTSISGQTVTVRVKQRKSVSWAVPVGFINGSIPAGDSISRSILVTVANLNVGSYNTNVIFETNDPSDPYYSVPLILTVVSEPDMNLSTNTLNYGIIYNSQPKTDSILVENNGCTDLIISNITSNNVHFVPGWITQTIVAGSSAFLPVTFTATTSGLETGILSFSNNDSIQLVTTQANVIFAPIADYQHTVQNQCAGLVSFHNLSSNGSLYFWDFGDGIFSSAYNPTHTYERPGTYTVMLVTTNSGGSDTTYKTVTLNDVLYVDFEFPTTVQAGQVTQFIDSSMYPVSWQWFFGDGNNSTTPNPQHTYANKGTYIVTLLAQNSAGCSGSSNKQIDVLSGIGIDESAPEDLAIYPVPTTGRLTVETTAEVQSISLYNMTGQFITEVHGERSLDLSTLPAGTYMIRIVGESWIIYRNVELVK